jgi:hypothetical protein
MITERRRKCALQRPVPAATFANSASASRSPTAAAAVHEKLATPEPQELFADPESQELFAGSKSHAACVCELPVQVDRQELVGDGRRG